MDKNRDPNPMESLPSASADFGELGFKVIPNFISADEQEQMINYLEKNLSILGSNEEANLSIAMRSRKTKKGNIIAVSEQKYGREFYIQTQSFESAADNGDGISMYIYVHIYI
jgi:hypothetical protein